MRILLLIGAMLCGLTPLRADAQTPVDAKIVAKWVDALTLNRGPDAENPGQGTQGFAALDPDLQFAILQKALPLLNVGSGLESVFERLVAYADASEESEPGQVKRLADNINPRLLDILNLGISDKRLPSNQSTLDLLNRDFGLKLSLKEYPDWYAKNGKRPVGDVMREGVTELVKSLLTEKEGMRTYLLDRLRDMPFTSATWMLREPEAKGLVAMRMTALRRQAALNAGLLDSLAVILRGGDIARPDPNDKTTPGISPIVRRKTLALLADFRPDTAYLARISPDLQREFAARIGKPDELQGVSPALLLACPGDWALPALNHWIEADYLRPDFDETFTPLLATHDVRVLPAAFALMKEPESNIADTAVAVLSGWKELNGPTGTTTKPWLDWWAGRPKTVPAAVFDEPTPHFPPPTEALLKRLTENAGMDGRAIQQFNRLNADAKVTLLRDHWKEIRNVSLRFGLLNSALRSVSPEDRRNPETLGLNGKTLLLFDAGMSSEAPAEQKRVLLAIKNLTGWTLADAAAYAAWRPAQTGKSNADLLREGCRSLAARLAEMKTDETQSLLRTAAGIAQARPFSEVTTPDTLQSNEKIAQIRRTALADAGVNTQVVGILNAATNPALQSLCMAYLVRVKPDAALLTLAEPIVRKLVETELAKKSNNGVNTELLAGVTLYNTPWATNALLACLQKRFDEQVINVLLPLVRQKEDPHLIPTLISLLDTAEPGEWQYDATQQTLAALTKQSPNESRDARAWALWWEKNKMNYPADVRALLYPRIGKGAARPRTFSLMQETRAVHFKDRTLGGYWRIASGYLVMLPPDAQAATYIPGGGPNALTEAQKPGLLIVLAKSTADFEKQKQYWMQFDRSALKGRYVIALVFPPAAPNEKSLWLLHVGAGNKPGATAQAIVAAAIADLQSSIPLSQTRRYCIGTGEGGLAALACGLSPSLGLRGVVADMAPFRSADLPALSNAKGQRVALLQDTSSHAIPEFVRTVTRQTLQKAGAVLRSADYDGKSAAINAAPFDALEAAVTWLESGR